MSTAFDRGMVYLGQGRHDLAAPEFRRALADDPDDPQSHAFLSVCLDDADDHAGALAEADEAARLAADWPFAHYARGRALIGLGRPRDAEAAADEAIRLDPDDADYRGLLASIKVLRRDWPGVLDAAEAGLALDAAHTVSANLRALALVNLGRRAEAADALGDALADDPENPLTHTNQGWALLHKGDHEGALVHFTEALRLDPEFAWARAGIVEALKARHLIYRQMLKFFLWMSRLSTRAQWVVLLFFVFGRRVLGEIGRNQPALTPLIDPILYLTFAFLVLTWVASPLFNFLIQLNRYGRYALTRDDRIAANVIGPVTIVALACLVTLLVHRTPTTVAATAFFGLLLFPLTITFNAESGKTQFLLGLGTLGIAALGLPALLLLLHLPSPVDPRRAAEWFGTFISACFLSTWIPALIGVRAAVR